MKGQGCQKRKKEEKQPDSRIIGRYCNPVEAWLKKLFSGVPRPGAIGILHTIHFFIVFLFWGMVGFCLSSFLSNLGQW